MPLKIFLSLGTIVLELSRHNDPILEPLIIMHRHCQPTFEIQFFHRQGQGQGQGHLPSKGQVCRLTSVRWVQGSTQKGTFIENYPTFIAPSYRTLSAL